jgi:hypothetical protein
MGKKTAEQERALPSERLPLRTVIEKTFVCSELLLDYFTEN